MKQRARPQVNDDPELLKLMLQDTQSASDLYKPTNFWLNLEKRFLPELRRQGLRDFRRRKFSVLSSFGATDLLPISRARPHKTAGKMIQSFLKLGTIEKLCTHISNVVTGVRLQDVRLLYYELAKSYGEKNSARSIRELEASTVGNPEDVFPVDGNLYTPSLLRYYIQYAYCCQFMDFDSINRMMEIGSGSGKQIEVTKKLHPDICFYVVDIPPQLYVCEQYLSALFPDSVVSYRKTRTMKSIPEERQGKVFIIGNWKIPEFTNLNYDLFWNSASFQEMEPNVVLNYLEYVNQQTNKYVFLCERMEGQFLATKKGEIGVLERTTLEHYKKGLVDFELQDLSRAIFPSYISKRYYSFSFWFRK